MRQFDSLSQKRSVRFGRSLGITVATLGSQWRPSGRGREPTKLVEQGAIALILFASVALPTKLQITHLDIVRAREGGGRNKAVYTANPSRVLLGRGSKK